MNTFKDSSEGKGYSDPDIDERYDLKILLFKPPDIPSQSDLEKSLTLWRAVFSNSYFYISDGRFRILVKNCLHKVPFFFQYSNRNRVKNEKNPVLPYFLELTLQFASFLRV